MTVGGELLSVRNGSHVSHVCDGVAVFRDDVSQADVVLQGSDRTLLKCHRVVLAAASPLLADLLALHPIVGDEDVHIVVPTAPAHVLTKLLDFCYSGQTLVDKCHLQSLMDVASCLKIKFLKDVVVRVVKAAVKRPVNIRPKPSSVTMPVAVASTTSLINPGSVVNSSTTTNKAALVPVAPSASVLANLTGAIGGSAATMKAGGFIGSSLGAPASLVTGAITQPTSATSTRASATIAASGATAHDHSMAKSSENISSNAQAVSLPLSNELVNKDQTEVAKENANKSSSSEVAVESELAPSAETLKRKLQSKESQSDTDSADSDDEKGRNFEERRNSKDESAPKKVKKTVAASKRSRKSKVLPAMFTLRQQSDSSTNKEDASYLVHLHKNKTTEKNVTPKRNVKTNVLKAAQQTQAPLLVAKAIGNDGSGGQQKILLLKPTSKQPMKHIVVPSSSSGSSAAGDRGISKLVLSPPITKGNLSPMSPSFQIETLKQADGTQITFLRQVSASKTSTNPTTSVAAIEEAKETTSGTSVVQSTVSRTEEQTTSEQSDGTDASNKKSETANTATALKVNGKRMSVSQPRHVIPATLPEDFLEDEEPGQQDQLHQQLQPDKEKDFAASNSTKSRGNADKSKDSEISGPLYNRKEVGEPAPTRVSGRVRKVNKKYREEIVDSKIAKQSNESKTSSIKKSGEQKRTGGNPSKKEDHDSSPVSTTRGTRSKVATLNSKKTKVGKQKQGQSKESVAPSANARASKRSSALAAAEKMESSKRQRRSLRRN